MAGNCKQFIISPCKQKPLFLVEVRPIDGIPLMKEQPGRQKVKKLKLLNIDFIIRFRCDLVISAEVRVYSAQCLGDHRKTGLSKSLTLTRPEGYLNTECNFTIVVV